MLCFIWSPERTQMPSVGSKVGRLHRCRCRLPVVLEQGQRGAGFPGSALSMTQGVGWLSTSALLQCLQCSFYLFVGWATVPVCLGLRSLLRGRIFNTKTRKAPGKFGQLAVGSPPFRPHCQPPLSGLLSLPHQAMSLPSTVFTPPGALHTAAWWLLISHSAVSNSLWPHGLQHARLPCPSPSPRVCPNSCLLSQWCHLTISSSVVPFPFCLQSFPGLESLIKHTTRF